MISFEDYFLSLVGYLFVILFLLPLILSSTLLKEWGILNYENVFFIIICGTGTKVFFLMNECAKYHINDTRVLMK